MLRFIPSRLAPLVALLMLAGVPAPAQQPDGGDGRGGQGELGGSGRTLSDLPPSVRLGARAISLLEQTRAIPEVVIVGDGGAYLEAISHWTPRRRFPVLIDDGSHHAREQIARFVRAFEPERIVRYEPEDAEAFRGSPDALHDRLRMVQADIWQVPAPDAAETGSLDVPGARQRQLHEAWQPSPLLAPGVVVTHGRDSAWPAAIALASARAQPLVFLDPGKRVNARLSRTEGEAFARRVERACEQSGFAWRELGDRIEAITICLNTPAKVNRPQQDGWLAMTDLVGRHAGDTDGSDRWGWASQIFGSESDAAYMAMSSLFTAPSNALLFDGYPNEAPWTEYDAAPAAGVLEEAGLETTLRDAPQGSARAWRMMASSPVAFDLLFVNTKGNRDFFDLEPGRAHPGDVPLLEHPAIVNFIHSWSAVQPGRRQTIAGRWFERGAIAYMGAVHEPYLKAFLPPEKVARRLASSYPWAIAPRYDRAQPWKVALFGDALLTLTGEPERDAEAELPLEGVEDVAERAAAAMGEREFTAAARRFALLGRDEDAARLASALLSEASVSIDGELASALFMPVIRAGSREDQIALFRRLPAKDRSASEFLDAIWLSLAPALSDPQHATEAISLLAQHVREDQIDGDGITLARAIARSDSSLNPISFLRSLEPKNKRQRRAIRQEIERLGGGGGGGG